MQAIQKELPLTHNFEDFYEPNCGGCQIEMEAVLIFPSTNSAYVLCAGKGMYRKFT